MPSGIQRPASALINTTALKKLVAGLCTDMQLKSTGTWIADGRCTSTPSLVIDGRSRRTYPCLCIRDDVRIRSGHHINLVWFPSRFCSTAHMEQRDAAKALSASFPHALAVLSPHHEIMQLVWRPWHPFLSHTPHTHWHGTAPTHWKRFLLVRCLSQQLGLCKTVVASRILKATRIAIHCSATYALWGSQTSIASHFSRHILL